MKVFLMHPDRDFDVKPELRDEIFDAMLSGDLFALTRVWRDRQRKRQTAPDTSPGTDYALAQDLELNTLWGAMAAGDDFLFQTAKRATLSGLRDAGGINYRQRVLADCLERPALVRQLYELSIEALENERKAEGGLWSTDRPEMILNRSVRVLTLHLDALKRLRQIADQHSEGFRSEGFTRFFVMLKEELNDEYLQTVEQQLRDLAFSHGLLESAKLGIGDKGRDYTVRRMREQRWTERLPFGNRTPSYSFTIAPRDEAGFKALEEVRGRGINHLANAVAQAADHIKSFFSVLRLEIAFYLGCLNLQERLEEKGEPICFPEPLPEDEPALSTAGLYDVCLTLHIQDRVIGNEIGADGKPLVMITGANQGGKSTLLRSLGLAHLMTQSGMFVAARSFSASICTGVFAHYKREEDATMAGGKLDEELSRMSEIADQIGPYSILLCNESFASTNEREGSEIARQVIRAMLAKQIKVFFVTHMYDLAHGIYEQHLDTALFLRAERETDGRRTFKLVPGEPLPTSYGEDSYRRIFGSARMPRAAAANT
jgi:hypothetical protein